MLLCLVKANFGFSQEVGDVLGAGAGQADGGDDASVAVPEEPVSLGGDGWHGWSLS